MKKIIFYTFMLLLSLSLPGCHFLRGEGDDFSADQGMMEDEYETEDTEESDSFLVEDDDMGDSSMEEDGFFADGEPSEDFLDGELEEEEGGKKKGFFARLFGGGKDKEESEDFEEIDFAESDFEEGDFAEGDFENESPISDESFNPEESSASGSETESEGSSNEENLAVSVAEEQSTASEATTDQAPQRKPLNKVLEFAYKKAGFLVNAVYIARPNQTLRDISQKIYGTDRTADLLAINSHLEGRALVVGDKIYYNSPNRPNDNKRILFYYQDNNISPSYYTLSEGDNIRTVASQLLGHPKSWKEIWATNPDLESKGNISSSTQITYWTDSMPVASFPENVVPPNDSSEIVSDMPNDKASDDVPSFDQPESPPEPNLPEEDLFPKVPIEEESLPEENETGKGFQDFLLANRIIIGLGLVFLILIAFLIFRIISKKRREQEFDYTSV